MDNTNSEDGFTQQFLTERTQMLARLKDAEASRQRADQLNIQLMSEATLIKDETARMRKERDYYMRFAMSITAELHAIAKVIDGSIKYAEEHADIMQADAKTRLKMTDGKAATDPINEGVAEILARMPGTPLPDNQINGARNQPRGKGDVDRWAK